MKQGKNNTNNNNNKKKRSRPQKKKKVNSSSVGFGGEEEKQEKDHYYEEESKILSTLMEAFFFFSLEEAASAYKEANHDPNRAAEILGLRLDNFTSSFCSSSEGYNMEANKDFRGGGGACNNNNKAKKVIASTGTVSSMLGKDYLKRKDTITINSKKGLNNMHLDKDGAEQFLCSMLGDECELSMAVVRDVFCEFVCLFPLLLPLYTLLFMSLF